MTTTFIAVILALCFAQVPAAYLPPFMCDTLRCNEGDVDEFCSDEQYPRCMACVDADFLCGTENMPNKCYKYCTEKEVKRRLLREKDKICPLLENTPLVSFNASANSTHGEIVLATCPPGRHLSGANIIQCHFGEWSPLPPTCIVTHSATGHRPIDCCLPVVICLGVGLVLAIVIIIALVYKRCKAKKPDYTRVPLDEIKVNPNPPTPSGIAQDETCKMAFENENPQDPVVTIERNQEAVALPPRSVDNDGVPNQTADPAPAAKPTFVTPTAPPADREEPSISDEMESATSKPTKPTRLPKPEDSRAGESKGVKTPPATETHKGPPVSLNVHVNVSQGITNGGATVNVGNINRNVGSTGTPEGTEKSDDKGKKTSNTCRAEDFNSVPTQESSLNDSDFIPKPTSIITAVQPESAQVDPSHTDSAPVDPPPAAQSLHTQPCDRTDKGWFLLRDNIAHPKDINI